MENFCSEKDVLEIIDMLGESKQAFSGKTILLTGGRGFLGRYFSETFATLNKREILKEPCKVVSVDNLITAGPLGEADSTSQHGVEFHKANVIDGFSMPGKVDFIFHMAGIASPYYYRAFPLETLDVAITGTRKMLDMAKDKGAKLIFFSSSEIYGDPDSKHVPTAESYRGNVSCLGPRACYDESKRVGETLCRIYHTQFGVDTAMIRPFNVYGPGMQEKDYRVLPNFASRIKNEQPLKIYGSGNQTRTFCYITDAVAGFMKVAAHGVPGEPYNIGNPTPELSMLELAKEIEKVLGQKVAVDIVEYPDSYPADEPNRRCPDISKSNLQLGYQPRVTLQDGLKRFMDYSLRTYTKF